MDNPTDTMRKLSDFSSQFDLGESGDDIDAERARNFLKSLKNRIRITKVSRFNAHRRLKQRAGMGIFALSFLSIMIISLSVFSMLFADDLSPFQVRIFGLGTVIISVFTFGLNIWEMTRGYDQQAYSFLKSGELLTNLSDEIDLSLAFDDLDVGIIFEISYKYEKIIKEF